MLKDKITAAFAELARAIGALDGIVAALPGGGGGSMPDVLLAADVANSTTALADATGMSLALDPLSSYIIWVDGDFTSAATTTGIALALNGTNITKITGWAMHPISATAPGSCEQIALNATTGATTGVRAANTSVPLTGRWKVTTGAAAATVQLRFRSEVAASAVTLKSGLVMRCEKL